MSVKMLSPYLVMAAAGGALIFGGDVGLPALSPPGQPAAASVAAAAMPRFMLVADAAPDSQKNFRQPFTPAAGEEQHVDESAIYYYASQGDWERMRAEINRLKALYPHWTPPANPEAGPAGVVDEETRKLWSLFSEGRYPALRDAIATHQQRDPQWQPPADLVEKLGEAEARQRLLNAAGARQWETVLSVATDHAGLLVCPNMEVLWSVAEAFVATDKPSRGVDVYNYILDNCDDKAERAATLDKASALLPLAEAEKLLARDKDAAPANALDTLVRRRVGEAAQGKAETASVADIARMEQLVAAVTTTPDDAMALAFYLHSHREPERAAQLFKLALDRGGGAKAAEGYVLAMSAQGRFAEVEPLAHEWRGASPENMEIYLDGMVALLLREPPPRIDEAAIARLVAVAVEGRLPAAGHALGWYAYNTGQVRTAERWFIEALKWDRAYEPAAHGLAVARQRLGNRKGLLAVVNAWRDRSPRIADLVDRPGRRPSASAAARQPEPGASPAAGSDIDALLFGASPSAAPAAPARASPRAESAAAGAFDRMEASDREVAQNRESQNHGRSNRSGDSAGERTSAPARAGPQTASRANARRCASSASLHGVSGLPAASALSLGWCLMELDRPMEAVRAFEAVQAKSGDAGQRKEAAYGKSLAYLRVGLTNKAALAASEARIGPGRQRDLSVALLTQQAIAAYDAERYTETLFALDARQRQAPEQTDLMLLRGWSNFHLGRFDEAERVFRLLQKTGVSTAATQGLTAIAERLNRIRY